MAGKILYFTVVLGLILQTNCATLVRNHSESQSAEVKISDQVKSVNESKDVSASDHLLMATLWYQKSAENRALYYQSYNYAKLSLDNQLKNQKEKSKFAIVLDIDETVLDNSPYQAMLILKGLSFSSEHWKEWTKLAKAKALPGAVEFTNYAKSKGCEVFYVSNRDEDEKDFTIKNLKDENFPYADEKHVLLRANNESDKNPRFQLIEKEYNLLLFVGDSLPDFDKLFANRIDNYGFKNVDDLKNMFGEKYILLPNPMYGDWEKSIYGGNYPGEIEKNKLRKQNLHSF